MGGISFKRFWAGLLLAAWALAAHAVDRASTHVLLFNSYSTGRVGFDRITEAFVVRLHASGIPLENIHVEYLHLNQPNAEATFPARRALLQAQYGGRRVDILVALQPSALNFVLHELADLAPQAPLLTDSEPSALQVAETRRRLFHYPIVPDVGATIKEVMLLMPRTRRIVIPGGVSDADRAFQRKAEVDLAPWLRSVQVEFLQNMSWPEQMRYIGNLTPDAVVVTGMFNRDREGYALATHDAAIQTISKANVPVFGLLDIVVGEGAVGGAVRNLSQSGTELAERALDILDGRQPSSGALTQLSAGPLQTLYDWRQLERWKIDPAPLAHATFLHRPPSLWRAYRGAVLGAAALVLLQAVLLAALLLRRRRLR